MDATDQLEDHQARCLPHLLTLRMLARYTPEVPLPWLAAAGGVAQVLPGRRAADVFEMAPL